MKRKIIRLAPLLIIVTVIVSYNIVKRNRLDTSQLQPSTTATSFMIALVRNDEKALTELVIPQQREEVFQWLSSHRPFYCPPGLDFPIWHFPPRMRDLTNIRPISQRVHLSQNFSHSTRVSFYALYQCRIDINSDRGLNFEVYDIIIEQKDDKWYVKSWQFVCESKRLNGCM